MSRANTAICPRMPSIRTRATVKPCAQATTHQPCMRKEEKATSAARGATDPNHVPTAHAVHPIEFETATRSPAAWLRAAPTRMTMQMLLDLTYDGCATVFVGCTSQMPGDSEIRTCITKMKKTATRRGEKGKRKYPMRAWTRGCRAYAWKKGPRSRMRSRQTLRLRTRCVPTHPKEGPHPGMRTIGTLKQSYG